MIAFSSPTASITRSCQRTACDSVQCVKYGCQSPLSTRSYPTKDELDGLPQNNRHERRRVQALKRRR